VLPSQAPAMTTATASAVATPLLTVAG
jgi:hypothetical protein